MKNKMKKFLCIFLVVLMCITSAPLKKGVFKAEASYYQVGDIIQFGSYPQSEVKDPNLITNLNSLAPGWDKWTNYGYYTGESGIVVILYQGAWMKYVDISYNGNKYRGVKFTQYRPELTCTSSSEASSYQDDNGYKINTTYWFKYEPIKWRVINSNMIVSETIIDSQDYCGNFRKKLIPTYYYNDSGNYINDYKTSYIRTWLNNSFYNTAFTDSEKEAIKTTTLNDEGYSSNGLSDKLFLPSYNEINDSTQLSSTIGSDYAKCQGLLVYKNTESEFNGNSFSWFTRTPSSDSEWVYAVNHDGSFKTSYNAACTFCGIRPALSLDMEVYDAGPQLLIGYDPTADQYNFTNSYAPNGAADYIDKKYYTTVLGDIYGTIEFSALESKGKQHGVCFGMASTTAAFIKDKSKINNYYIPIDDNNFSQAKKMFDIVSPFNTFSPTKMLTIEDYIKYAHVYQQLPTIAYERTKNMNKLELLYATVKNQVDSNGNPIIVDFASKTLHLLKHSVLAVGYREAAENYIIYIDDPNDIGITELIISKDYKTWSSRNYSSDSNSITFNTADVSNLEQESPELAISSKTLLIKATGNLSTDKDLILSSSSNTDELIESENKYSLYWTKEETEQICIIPEEEGSISVACYSSAITVEGKEGRKINFNIGKNTDDSVSYEVDNSEQTTMSFLTSDNEGTLVDIKISGYATGSEVTATQTETGLLVTGISNGTITLSKNDEIVSTQKITFAESDITITYDKIGRTEGLDVDYIAHSHTYESTITKEATHFTEGEASYNCSCGDNYTEVILALPHTYNTTVVAPTCETEGYTTYTCICGDTYNDNYIPATGHSYTNQSCTNCGQKCSHLCHKTGFLGFIWKIVRFFWKLFKINPNCVCGTAHY